MLIAIIALCIGLLLLAVYVVFIKLQLHSMNLQLKKRLAEHTRQPVSLTLLDKGLNRLAVNINNCLKAEESLRLDVIREEKQFKEAIANISHDLRTPLTAIKGYQQLIGKGTLSDEQRRKLKIAQKHADELGSLIEHFFEYSCLLNADMQPKLERLNLSNLTAECLVEFITIFEEKHLAVHFDEPVPIFVLADKEKVIRIIRNLICNCIQHSKSDVEVKLAVGQMVELSFENAVCKEEKIDVNRFFDRFYTADKARSGNTGLGLSIVKLLTEQMGGKTSATIQDGCLKIKVGLPAFDQPIH
jgi:signal transduction histidine kinase